MPSRSCQWRATVSPHLHASPPERSTTAANGTNGISGTGGTQQSSNRAARWLSHGRPTLGRGSFRGRDVWWSGGPICSCLLLPPLLLQQLRAAISIRSASQTASVEADGLTMMVTAPPLVADRKADNGSSLMSV